MFSRHLLAVISCYNIPCGCINTHTHTRPYYHLISNFCLQLCLTLNNIFICVCVRQLCAFYVSSGFFPHHSYVSLYAFALVVCSMPFPTHCSPSPYPRRFLPTHSISFAFGFSLFVLEYYVFVCFSAIQPNFVPPVSAVCAAPLLRSLALTWCAHSSCTIALLIFWYFGACMAALFQRWSLRELKCRQTY